MSERKIVYTIEIEKGKLKSDLAKVREIYGKEFQKANFKEIELRIKTDFDKKGAIADLHLYKERLQSSINSIKMGNSKMDIGVYSFLNNELKRTDGLLKKYNGGFINRIGNMVNDVKYKFSTLFFGGAILTGISQLGNYFINATKAAIEEAKANATLEQSLKRIGVTSKEVKEQLLDTADKLENSLFSSETITKAQAFALSLGLPSKGLEDLTAVAMDFAQGAGISLEQAFKIIAKRGDDNEQVLSRLGIKLSATDNIVEVLKNRFGGSVKAITDTTKGMESLSKTSDDFNKAIGKQFIPVMDLFAGALAAALKFLMSLPGPIKAILGPIGSMAAAVLTLIGVFKILSLTAIPQLSGALLGLNAALGVIGALIAALMFLINLQNQAEKNFDDMRGFSVKDGQITNIVDVEKAKKSLEEYRKIISEIRALQKDKMYGAAESESFYKSQRVDTRLSSIINTNGLIDPDKLENAIKNIESKIKITPTLNVDPNAASAYQQKLQKEIDLIGPIQWEIKMKVNKDQILKDTLAALDQLGKMRSTTAGTDKLFNKEAALKDLFGGLDKARAAGLVIDERDMKLLEQYRQLWDIIIQLTNDQGDKRKDDIDKEKEALDNLKEAVGKAQNQMAAVNQLFSDFGAEAPDDVKNATKAISDLGGVLSSFGMEAEGMIVSLFGEFVNLLFVVSDGLNDLFYTQSSKNRMADEIEAANEKWEDQKKILGEVSELLADYKDEIENLDTRLRLYNARQEIAELKGDYDGQKVQVTNKINTTNDKLTSTEAKIRSISTKYNIRFDSNGNVVQSDFDNTQARLKQEKDDLKALADTASGMSVNTGWFTDAFDAAGKEKYNSMINALLAAGNIDETVAQRYRDALTGDRGAFQKVFEDVKSRLNDISEAKATEYSGFSELDDLMATSEELRAEILRLEKEGKDIDEERLRVLKEQNDLLKDQAVQELKRQIAMGSLDVENISDIMFLQNRLSGLGLSGSELYDAVTGLGVNNAGLGSTAIHTGNNVVNVYQASPKESWAMINKSINGLYGA